jgi:hypothetical protein
MVDNNVFNNEPHTPGPLTFEEAMKLLGSCKRYESRDHYFNDREVYWSRGDSEVAEGYFGGGSGSVYIHEEFGGGSFIGEEARELATRGSDPEIGRNDETGPDFYAGP